jgi:hypothetical protein
MSEWHEGNITVGAFYTRNSYPKNSKNVSGLASVTYQIGWDCTESDRDKRYRKINVQDGMICGFSSIAKIADFFNSDKFGFRRTTKKELVKMIKQQAER